MKTLLHILLLFTISLSVNAQKKASNKPSIGNVMKLGAEQITFIKQNGIFLRLRTNDKAITALMNAGNLATAGRLRAQQNELDSKIIQAFREQYKFAPVYYFYSRDLESLKAGDYSNAFKIDGTPANYSNKDFFMVDPYTAENKRSDSQTSGFTLLNENSEPVIYPMPIFIVRRYGPFYKTYPQMVYTWNAEFFEMNALANEIKNGEIAGALKSSDKYTGAETRALAKMRKYHRRNFLNNYNGGEKPKRVNHQD